MSESLHAIPCRDSSQLWRVHLRLTETKGPNVSLNFRTYQSELAGWRINIVVAGNGPLILLLHGIGLSWQWWQPTMAALSHDFTVCAVDLPGSGRSTPLTSPPEPEAYSRLVAGIIDSLDLGPAIVVGHSLGGYVAVQAAIQQAPGISRLILAAPAGFGLIHNPFMRLLSIPIANQLLIRANPIGLRSFLQSLVHDPRSISDEMLHWANVSLAARQQFVYQLNLALRFGRTLDTYIIKDAPPLSVPILLLWGRYDSVFPLHVAYQAQQVLHDPPLLIFEQSGHFLQFEETDRFYSVLRSFASEGRYYEKSIS